MFRYIDESLHDHVVVNGINFKHILSLLESFCGLQNPIFSHGSTVTNRIWGRDGAAISQRECPVALITAATVLFAVPKTNTLDERERRVCTYRRERDHLQASPPPVTCGRSAAAAIYQIGAASLEPFPCKSPPSSDVRNIIIKIDTRKQPYYFTTAGDFPPWRSVI